jgi:hypothetical protein
MEAPLDTVPPAPALGLLTVYLIFMAIGDLIDYAIGLGVEYEWPQLSLPIFLGLYFFSLWAAWRLALMVTEPKRVTLNPRR